MPASPARRLTRLLAVAVVTLGLTPALQGHAWACSCVTHGEVPTEEETYRAAATEAKYVYVGHVDSERLDGDTMTGTYVYAVTVTEPLKGPPTERRRLRTAANGGLCGSRAEVGKAILVVDQDGHGSLSSCGDLTTQEHVARRASYVRDALRGPTMPRTGGDAGELWPLLLAAGLVAERRRRAHGASG